MPRFVFAILVALVSCAAPRTPVHSSLVHRFHIGSLEAVALKDGDIFVPNDGKTVGIGQPPEATAALLGRPTDTIDFSIQSLLVRDGERVLLFDTGAGDASFARGGLLPSALEAAAIAPSSITDVFLSHGHPDHVGGLVTKAGRSAFPGARIRLAEAEWASLRADAEAARVVAIMAPHVQTFAPDATILPSVTAVEVRGHTPGHTAYRIRSGADQLLFIGDSAHHSVVSVQRPEWTIAFDLGGDPRTAEASRRALLERAANERLRLFAGHFPFPGLGQIQRRGNELAWLPE